MKTEGTRATWRSADQVNQDRNTTTTTSVGGEGHEEHSPHAGPVRLLHTPNTGTNTPLMA